MRLATAILLLALGCSSAPEPLPTPIVLTPRTSPVMFGGEYFRQGDTYFDTATKVAAVTYAGSSGSSAPDGPHAFVNFYFAGIWKNGQVTLDDVEQTLIAAYPDPVLSAIPAPPNDRNGHYYIVLLPSPRPRAHSLSLMRVDADGPDVFNITLLVNFWGDADQRLAIQRAWVRDSSARWALELGRLTLDRRWRGRFLMPDAME